MIMIYPIVNRTFGWLLIGFPSLLSWENIPWRTPFPAPPEERKKQLAQRLIELDVLQRKVVKQTVMTICYGVTNVLPAAVERSWCPQVKLFISQ
jgi:hypothetical protein